MLDDYTRAQVNRAVEDALRPSGMSVHSGRASIDAGMLQRLIVMIDRSAEASLEALDQIAVLDVENARLRTALAKANSHAEYFERLWYLNGDAVDRLRKELAEASNDAARYRLLRRGQHWSVIDGIGNELRAEALDAAVDAAMRKEDTDAR